MHLPVLEYILIYDMDTIDKIQKCYRCGFAVQWDSDCMSSEISDDFPENDSSITSFFTCPNCGATMEVMDASDEEKKNYPKFNNPTPDKPMNIFEMAIATYPDDDSLGPGGMEGFHKQCTKVVCRTAYSMGARDVLKLVEDELNNSFSSIGTEVRIENLIKRLKERKTIHVKY